MPVPVVLTRVLPSVQISARRNTENNLNNARLSGGSMSSRSWKIEKENVGTTISKLIVYLTRLY